MEKKININIISLLFVAVLMFFVGFFIHKDIRNKKEIMLIKEKQREYNRYINMMKDTIVLKTDTILKLKRIIEDNNIVIASYKKDINKLKYEIKNISSDIPINEQYEYLQNITYPDTNNKIYCFSDSQINKLYVNENELVLQRQLTAKYESITEAMNYNIVILSKSDSIKTSQLETCLRTTDAYQKMINLKDDEIKQWKKKDKSVKTWATVSTGISVGLLLIILF